LWHLSHEAFIANGEIKSGILDRVVEGAKREIIEIVNSKGYVYAECSHRLSYFCYQIKRMFPKARFIYINRSLDDFVRSAYTWGFYHAQDRYIRGRIKPHNFIDLTRSQVIAWYWYATNNFIMDFLETIPFNDWFYFPFEWIREWNLEKIRAFYNWLGPDSWPYIPSDKELHSVLAAKANSQARIINVKKDWSTDQEDEIFARIGGINNG